MFNVDQMVRLQLNHYHYLTLLRLQEHVQALLQGLQNLANSPSDVAVEMPSLCPPAVCIGLLIPAVTISLMLPASHSPVQQEDSERSSLVGFEMTDGDTASEKEKNKLIQVNKNEGTPFGLNLAQEPMVELAVKQGVSARLAEHTKAEQVEVPVKDSSNKVLPPDTTQAKELSVDLFLGKDARDTFLNTLGLTKETFSLGKERMQRLLGDTKHKCVTLHQILLHLYTNSLCFTFGHKSFSFTFHILLFSYDFLSYSTIYNIMFSVFILETWTVHIV